MNIAMLYAYWENEPWSTPIGVRKELERRGHNLTDWNLYHNDGIIQKKGEIRKYSIQGLMQLLNAMKAGTLHIDVVFHMDYGVFDHVALDRQHWDNAIWVMESGDDPQAFVRNRMKVHKFDIIHTPDYECWQQYYQGGLNAHWLTHYADTTVYHPMDDVPIEFDCVTTCGSRGKDGTTDKIQAALGRSFFNDRFYWGTDHAKFMNRGKMVFQHSQWGEITRRIFEGMACGKMMIADRLPERTRIDDILIGGEDIVYYDSVDDAVDKIRYYANHDDERERIAKNGMNKVWESHSTAVRVEYLLNEIERVKLERMQG